MAQRKQRKGAEAAPAFDRDGNSLSLYGFFCDRPEFALGSMALASVVQLMCWYNTTLKAKLADGRAAQYGAYDTLAYTFFAILATFAAHGWFCVHVGRERQFQAYEKSTRAADGRRMRPPQDGEAFMRYRERPAPVGASVRSTAALLTSWVYAFYPFGAASTSWPAFVGWTIALAVYWDAHFFVAHKLFHEHPALYKFFHKKHHFYTAPDVFSAYYVTYQSHFVTEQLVVLVAALAGLPRDVFTWAMFLGTFDTCVKHSGHDVASVQPGLPISYETLMTVLSPWSLVLGGASTGEHDWHHEAFTKNYALSFTYLDKLLGSYHTGRVAGEAVTVKPIKRTKSEAAVVEGVEGVVAWVSTEERPASPPPSPPSPPSAATGALALALPLVLAYGAMVYAQTSGPQIVGMLHGAAAQLLASKPPEDVAPGTPLLELCKGYAHHHFDSYANALHAAGMTAGLVSVAVGLSAKHLTRLERVASLLWHPPQWYLYAWFGHFGLQKDVPAVFTYGLTPKSFLQGEFCSTMWVYTGAVFDSKPSLLPSLLSTGASTADLVPTPALALFAAAVFAMIAFLTPPGRLWTKEYRARAAAKAKVH